MRARRKPKARKRAFRSSTPKARVEPRKLPLVGLRFGTDWSIINEHTGETVREGVDMRRACAIVYAQDLKARVA